MIFWYNFFPEFYRIVPVQTMDDGTEKDKEMPEVATNTNQNCSEAKTNGHISPVD
jgi:hypothetical protein